MGKKASACGPCSRLEQRCQSLLKALENKSASEWRGCNERTSPAVQAAKAQAAKSQQPCKGTDANTSDSASGQEAPAPNGENATEAADTPNSESNAEASTSGLMEETTELDITSGNQELQTQTCYTSTLEWRRVRALCVRSRICVDFNRDASDDRCSDANCCFKHKCALCGAMQQGSRRFQHKYHGAWNCHLLLGWLAEQQDKQEPRL